MSFSRRRRDWEEEDHGAGGENSRGSPPAKRPRLCCSCSCSCCQETKDFYQNLAKGFIEERKTLQRERQEFYQNSQLQLKLITEEHRRMQEFHQNSQLQLSELITEQHRKFNTLISEIWRPGDYLQQYTSHRSTSDQSQIRTHRMKFQNRCCREKFSGHDVMADDGNPIKVAIYDQDNKIMTHGPLSLMQVKIVVLDGEFNNDHKEQWSEDYFRSKIVSGRPGKPPLFSNELYLRLENGVADLYGVKFQDISRFLPSGKFKLGVMAADDNISEKIQEGISEPFAVKHGRGFPANKDHPPSLSDPVYKLNKIAPSGRRHKLLEQKGIQTVQDFLRFYNKDKNSLREVFGRIPDHDWNAIVEHARSCNGGRIQYSYYIQERDVTILFDSLYSIIGAKFSGTYTSYEKLNKTHKDLVEAYRTTAYDNLEAVRYEDENACKEHELIFGDKDNSILPSPTLPTQFCDEPSHQDEVLESVPPRASPRSHQRWVKIVTKIIITASTLHIWKEPKEKRELSISVKELQPGSYPAGNIAVNDGASGSTGISLHPMVTNNQTTALTSFSDAHTRAPIPNFSAAQRPLEGHHNLIFPTVASAPISRNAISDVGIQSAGSCSISPAQCTRAPKRPTKAGKGIKGIKNFAAIGMNVPGSTPHSTAPAAGTVRSDHEIGGSSWNQGYTGVLQMNTATRNDNIAVSKSSNWNRHDATPHSADGSGNWNLNNFASQLNAAPYNTAGYSSIHNDRQEGGISCNLSSANIATQLNAYPLNAAFGYSNIRNNNKIGASSSNNSSTYMATQHAAVPQNTAMHSTHEQDGTQTNWSSTTNAMELNAIPHTTVGGYPEMHNGHQNDAGNSYMNLINIETALVTAFAETSCWDGEIGDSDSVWDWDPADILLRNDFNMNSEQQMANPVDPYQTAYADQDNTGTARRSS